MKKQIITAALLLTTALMAGCGSGGSSMMTNPTSTGKSTISGAVADGYLANAQVFLDKNFNYTLDAGEPNTVTDATGSYTLTIDPADAGKYPIVAVAIAGQTTDLDDPAQKIANSYVLSMHAVSVSSSATGDVTGSVSNFISPISTQLREMMESGKYATVQAATEALRAELGMPATTNMMGNYIANSNSSMHTAARNMAAQMGNQMALVMTGNRVDINRYRGMMGSIFGNMSTIKSSASPQNPGMTQMRERMAQAISAVPMMTQGQPFRNFSAAFRPRMIRGGMM